MAGSFPFIPTAPSTTRSAISMLTPLRCCGLAFGLQAAPEPRFLSAALSTLSVLDQHFKWSTGGYHSVLPADHGKREQNPHMHLLRAMLRRIMRRRVAKCFWPAPRSSTA